ncbi:anthrone oxygenase family protein [Marinitenerispora sediminis]|uniref:DUF1772 domain-containing protein n=1 Tax=Marinitenerispora sediminis TaxID=1931232 RepID=A0A368T6H3_9ACTN|nr:anthrone oxygenase family protein [Marinitenerispora sediminis]RCV51713.1 DUF1772 domain-containing protein [Marinitenerispora sediminis]RCV55096.1 DUF1772 domain-containing protein [Marinitenerispora sediminis]RCV59089.1 DUF1772 domain-containing protein [Marinitenerispora sediminis]
MTDLIAAAALPAATLTTGLAAGLYYGFACAVMPGLARTDDRTLVTAMRHVNEAILNGWFLLLFLGSPAATALALASVLGGEGRAALPWTAGALAAHVAVLAITFAGNVPLNNALARSGPAGPEAPPAAARAGFERPWRRWNTLRTAAAAVAFGCLVMAMAVGE